MLALQDGPTVLVGHSYGGQIMTALGADAPNVVALVYIAAFGLDEGESLGALLGQGPVTPALAHRFVDERGFVWLSEDDFVNHFAADVDPVEARVLYAVQQPLAAAAFDELMGVPAWKSLPSWYLVATDDEALPPDAERLFAKRMGATVVEVPSSHLAMVSHPGDVAKLTGAAVEARQPHWLITGARHCRIGLRRAVTPAAVQPGAAAGRRRQSEKEHVLPSCPPDD